MRSRTLVALFGRLPGPLQYWLVRRATPNYTLGVQVVLYRPDGALLVVKQPYRDAWFLPGGTVRRGETPGQALAREVKEELGVCLQFSEPEIAEVVEHLRWVTWHTALSVDEETAAAVRAASPEIERVEWCQMHQLPRMAPGVMKVVNRWHSGRNGTGARGGDECRRRWETDPPSPVEF